MTRDEQAELRTDAQVLAARLERAPEIIAPVDATIVVEAADAIGGGRHPESGTVFGSATIKHVTIILVSAAAVAAPAGIGTAIGGLTGGVLGAPVTWLGYEALKRTTFYKEATSALGAGFDEAVRRGEDATRRQAIRLTPFRQFVTQNEEPLRRIATTMPQSRWMLRYIDFIIRTNTVPAEEP